MTRLWVDDLRPAPDGWVWAKSSTEALDLLAVMSPARVANVAARHCTIRAMPHPRDHDYEPTTPEWIADEIELAGDLDGVRRVFRRFTHRLVQTGEAPTLDALWGDAVAVLRARGAAGLVGVAVEVRQVEREAPRRRAPKRYAPVTAEWIAAELVAADLDGEATAAVLGDLWRRFRHRLARTRQGDIAGFWGGAVGLLRGQGRHELANLAAEVHERELSAVELRKREARRRSWVNTAAKRKAERHAEGRVKPGPKPRARA